MARVIPFLDTQRPIGSVNGNPIVLEPWLIDAWNDLVRRTGGQTTDAVSGAVQLAAQSTATVAAINAGAVTTSFSLTPTQPLSAALLTATTSQIVVAAHTRSESGVDTEFPAGTVADAVTTGATYYVYYESAAPHVYLATTDVAQITSTSAHLIGSLAVVPSSWLTASVAFALSQIP